ncbi:MAG: molybdopterin-binding oxidoreductase [Syntrophus sp. (in: bacteria)]|nr:molybdopterin-binding oxidoreductase [Syntrophus sp. (in: bacteria)]
MDDQKDSQAPDTVSIGRRLFLKASVILPFLLSIPASLRAFILSSLPVRTVERDMFVFNPKTGLLRWKESKVTEPYQMVIDGLIEKPLRLSYVDLMALPQVKQVSDFHCVEGWSVNDVSWGGIRFNEIVRLVKVKSEAKYAVFHALGTTSSNLSGQSNYTECLPIKDLLDPNKQCLLVLSMDGKPLPYDHGAPCRLISPFDLGYKSIKYVKRIEFSKVQKEGWWTSANPIYPVNAPVPPERLRNELPRGKLRGIDPRGNK